MLTPFSTTALTLDQPSLWASGCEESSLENGFHPPMIFFPLSSVVPVCGERFSHRDEWKWPMRLVVTLQCLFLRRHIKNTTGLNTMRLNVRTEKPLKLYAVLTHTPSPCWYCSYYEYPRERERARTIKQADSRHQGHSIVVLIKNGMESRCILPLHF